MTGGRKFTALVNEDGSFSILARIVSLDGTGSEVVPGEGPCIKQADIFSISCKVYDLGSNEFATTGTEITPAPTVTAASNMFDTLRTTGWPVAQDPSGYNFRHDLGPTYVPSPNNWYQIEYLFTLTSGGVVPFVGAVKTASLIES